MTVDPSPRWIKLPRQLLYDSLFFDGRKSAWDEEGLIHCIDLYCLAAWQDGAKLARGQVLLSVRFLCKRWTAGARPWKAS